MRKSTKSAESVTARFAAEVKEKAPKAASKAAKAADKTMKAAVEVAEGVTAEAKSAVAKAASKTSSKKACKETVYLQYLGKEIDKDDVIRHIKEVWTKELNNKIGDIHTLTVYMKPEENLAYYVINGDVTGSVAL